MEMCLGCVVPHCGSVGGLEGYGVHGGGDTGCLQTAVGRAADGEHRVHDSGRGSDHDHGR